MAEVLRRVEKLSSLLEVAKHMATTRDLDALLKLVVREASKVVQADRCSLFLVDLERKELWTKIAEGLEIREIRLPIGKGIVGQVAESGEVINIPDAYADKRFNQEVDKKTGYRTRTILTVPLKSTQGEVIGVLQALNRKDGLPFDADDVELALALGGQAAAQIDNTLLHEGIRRLFDGFIRASVYAIESRDPTTSGHSERVALLTVGLAQCVDHLGDGPYKDVKFSHEEIREIRYASLLHDFGKVGVREHVLVKAEKLYPYEMERLRDRFGFVRLDKEARSLRRRLELMTMADGPERARMIDALENEYKRDLAEVDEYLRVLEAYNKPTVLEEGGFERLREIASHSFRTHAGDERPYLTEDEVRILSIPRGSLSPEERTEIESHVTHTFLFLSQIPWTRDLKNVPNIAYGHHEKLDGKGYPRGIPAEDIPLQTRMMTISDIYDALTASDRPYKRAVPHDKALDILKAEANRKLIDGQLLEVFVEGKVHERIAKESDRLLIGTPYFDKK